MNQISPITKQDMTDALLTTALLADLTISMWGAERTDHKIMNDAKEAAGAVGNVGRAIKNLMAGADVSLRATRAAFTAVRSAHYTLTLPWVPNPHAERMTGPRLLPTLLFEKYLDIMSARKREAMAALDAFISEYPALASQAQANLAGLANTNDYPTPDQVRAAFHVSFDFAPIPSGQAFASFAGLPESWADRLAAGLHRKQTQMMEVATRAMFEQVRERIEHIVERLGKEDAKFKATTVENVRELIMLLPGWNITKDPRIDEIVDDIETMLNGIDAKIIREDAILRRNVAQQAADVTRKLNQWGV